LKSCVKSAVDFASRARRPSMAKAPAFGRADAPAPPVLGVELSSGKRPELSRDHEEGLRSCARGGATSGDVAPAVKALGQTDGMSIGEELLEERRRRRRAGDPRLTDAGREFLRRLVDGDLAEQFQAALNAVSAADPLLGGTED
jgi:hypothetical protein